jgi:hypothetical protein
MMQAASSMYSLPGNCFIIPENNMAVKPAHCLVLFLKP